MHWSKYIIDLDSHNIIKYAILTQSKNVPFPSFPICFIAIDTTKLLIKHENSNKV